MTQVPKKPPQGTPGRCPTFRAPLPTLHGRYGRTELPEQGIWHFVGATVWTCGPEGKIEGGEVIVHEGRIRAVERT